MSRKKSIMPLFVLGAGLFGWLYFNRTQLCVKWANGTCTYTLHTNGKKVSGVINPLLVQQETVPVGAHSLSIQTDGTGWVIFDVRDEKGKSLLTTGNAGIDTCHNA